MKIIEVYHLLLVIVTGIPAINVVKATSSILFHRHMENL